MQWPADYHMHTHLCGHASGTATDLAAQAVRAGLTEIGFSEHAPMLRDDYDDWHIKRADFPAYLQQIEDARRAFPDLTIRLALEVDYLPGHEAWIRELAGMHAWDYLIGSVHYVSDTWAVDNPHALDQWAVRDVDEVWASYLDRLQQAAACGLFDILGHADLCKKFGHRPRRDFTTKWRRLFEVMRETGMALELNTAGLRKDCAEIYPATEWVRLAREFEVPITFGSDAHAPGEVGANFAEAVDAAREAGYSHWCRFVQRRREFVPL